MTPTGTHFNYYHICRRKLWLFANGINMEHVRQREACGEDAEALPQISALDSELSVRG